MPGEQKMKKIQIFKKRLLFLLVLIAFIFLSNCSTINEPKSEFVENGVSLKEFKGNGISFSYLPKYTLFQKVKKNKKGFVDRYSIDLKSSRPNIQVEVHVNRLFSGYASFFTKYMRKEFKHKNWKLINSSLENKDIPLKAKNKINKTDVIKVKATKSVLTYEIIATKHENLKFNIPVTVTMFFFNYANRGYTIFFTQFSEPYSELLTVLKSFTFDKTPEKTNEDKGEY